MIMAIKIKLENIDNMKSLVFSKNIRVETKENQYLNPTDLSKKKKDFSTLFIGHLEANLLQVYACYMYIERNHYMDVQTRK